MLRSMTSKQWLEWNVMYSLEPWGEDREDLRFGSVVQALVNANRNAKKHPKPYSLIECSLSGGDQTIAHKQSWQQMKMTAMLLTGTVWKES